jgi:hypothetical protein
MFKRQKWSQAQRKEQNYLIESRRFKVSPARATNKVTNDTH